MTQQMFHEVAVARRQLLTPGMVRLTFAGEGLAAFASTGIGDEYVRLFFPDEATGETVLPIIDGEGRWTYPDGKPPVRYSTYTVRRFDAAARELDIDFVVHEGGLASEWAQAAPPGQRIVINNPRGLYQPPPDVRWQVLLADATGLPALARLLEDTPDDIASRVVIEVADAAHEQALPPHPRALVTWLHGSGNGLRASRLAEAFQRIPLPEGCGYLWGSGEQTAIRAIRQRARKMPIFQDGRSKLIAYWIEEGAEGRGRPEALASEASARIEADWSGLVEAKTPDLATMN